MTKELVIAFVPFEWVERALELGWREPFDLGHAPHDFYRVGMEWPHDSEPPMPWVNRSAEGQA